MRIFHLIVFLCLYFPAGAQETKINSIVVEAIPRFSEETKEFYFPIIQSDKIEVAEKINNYLKENFLQYEDDKSSIEKSIKSLSEEGLVDLFFEVTYNRNDLLSLQITSEYCGAYCSAWTEYYNFSTLTGQVIKMDAVVDLSAFSQTIEMDKSNLFNAWRIETTQQIMEENSDASQEEINELLIYGNECEEDFNLGSFMLSDEGITITFDCNFPHVMLALSPFIEWSYSWEELKPYLKIIKK